MTTTTGKRAKSGGTAAGASAEPTKTETEQTAAAQTEAETLPGASDTVPAPAKEAVKAGDAALPTQAAPLDPPAPAPQPPAPDPGPAPQIRMLATPGSEFVDLVWGDNEPGQSREKAQPDELFHDPGLQFSTVLVRRPLIRLFHMPGAQDHIVGEQLFKGAGAPLDRGHAEKIKADLAALRAAERAAEQ
ncbi:hypothetical protein ACWCSD_53065 [Nonomuraea sp. NPDC001684]